MTAKMATFTTTGSVVEIQAKEAKQKTVLTRRSTAKSPTESTVESPKPVSVMARDPPWRSASAMETADTTKARSPKSSDV